MAKIIGIDLGTSNTAAAVMEGGRGTIIPSAEGNSIVIRHTATAIWLMTAHRG